MNWQAANFFQAEGEQIVCTLCPHRCEFKQNGAVGECHVRRRQGNQLETASFATAVQHLDTIERKPLYHYKPASQVLTLASPGCSLRCLYCQNYRLSQFGRSEESTWQAQPASSDEIITYARQHQAAIGFSYAEPSLNAELTLELAGLARAHGIDIIWKSNGFLTPEAASVLAPCLSAVNIDLKSLDVKRHKSLTGAEIRPILDTIALFHEAGVWVEISTPLIPRINADEASLYAIARFIHSLNPHIPWHLGRFNPDYKLRHLPPTSVEMLAMGHQLALDVGLKHVYTERGLNAAGRTTYCANCSTPLLERDIWALKHNHLIDGACPTCHAPLAGHW